MVLASESDEQDTGAIRQYASGKTPHAFAVSPVQEVQLPWPADPGLERNGTMNRLDRELAMQVEDAKW